ncbi:MAG: PadR family transcriptional regulator [Candidatus Aminicenantes bacterium]|nr:PadR family transcriptional regulator [Candidatus Aminicenantes bacterium]
MKILSKPEELILLAVYSLKDNAYGTAIRNHIIQKTGTDWTIGAVYVPLNRLAKEGFLNFSIGDPTPERGGKRKKFYTLTPRGIKILAYTKKVNDSMWAHLSSMDLEALGNRGNS